MGDLGRLVGRERAKEGMAMFPAMVVGWLLTVCVCSIIYIVFISCVCVCVCVCVCIVRVDKLVVQDLGLPIMERKSVLLWCTLHLLLLCKADKALILLIVNVCVCVCVCVYAFTQVHTGLQLGYTCLHVALTSVLSVGF